MMVAQANKQLQGSDFGYTTELKLFGMLLPNFFPLIEKNIFQGDLTDIQVCFDKVDGSVAKNLSDLSKSELKGTM